MALPPHNNDECIAIDLLKDRVQRMASPGIIRIDSSAVHLEATVRHMDKVADEHQRMLETITHSLMTGWTRPINAADIVRSCQSVFDELFVDGLCIWGRIAIAYVFVAILTRQCVSSGHLQQQEMDSVVEQIGQHIAPRTAESIRAVGGWVCVIVFCLAKN